MSEKPRPEMPLEWHAIQSARHLIEQQVERAERAEARAAAAERMVFALVRAAGGRIEVSPMDFIEKGVLVRSECPRTGNLVFRWRAKRAEEAADPPC